jgi:hypothetical protein
MTRDDICVCEYISNIQKRGGYSLDSPCCYCLYWVHFPNRSNIQESGFPSIRLLPPPPHSVPKGPARLHITCHDSCTHTHYKYTVHVYIYYYYCKYIPIYSPYGWITMQRLWKLYSKILWNTNNLILCLLSELFSSFQEYCSHVHTVFGC